ncbi:alpha/beta hydrolase [Nitrosomonas sp.]|uniref:alpha/beta hydrolase n=1 Tax=Nitrosomonas sp. TaxID=42353 RepID=UPI0027317490|nr:alpha/beta hydrolase [Nitrosomonas sp.]MDP2222823.1 alpha/beta hydrolase [Nitrosomonas sp.]
MLLNLLIVLAVAYLGVVLLVYFGQPRLVYFPEKQLSITPEAIGLDYTSVNIATRDGEILHGWWMSVPDAKGTVLFFHGNAGNISHRINYLEMFKRLGYNTLLFDYRGYGQSSGVPSEPGTYLDAQAAWRYLTEIRGIAPAQIVLFGESLGGAVAAWLAAQEKPGLLALASTFTSIPDLAAKLYPFLPVRWISRFDYDTRKSLQSVTCPVFIAHSPQDEIIPFEHGQQLFQAAPEPKQFLELEGGHNIGFIFMQPLWIKSLGAFMDENLKHAAEL